MPTAIAYQKRGHPVHGNELVRTTIRWAYWCDICGKELQQRDGIYRPASGRRSAAGWCLECARAYNFLDLVPARSTAGDLDQIEKLYHFTDSRNVPSIREIGILGLDKLQEQGTRPLMTSTESSRQRDSRSQMSGYVRLTLHPHHPMAWKALYDKRSRRVTWLGIDASVLRQPGTKYSDKNALAADRVVGTNSRIATRGTDQAEAMVRQVPPDFVLDVIREISV